MLYSDSCQSHFPSKDRDLRNSDCETPNIATLFMFQAQPNNFCCCLEATDVKICLTRKHTWRRSTAPRTFAHTCYVHPQRDKHTSLCAAHCSQTKPKLGALQVEQSSAIPSVAVYCGSCGKCVHIIEGKSDRRGLLRDRHTFNATTVHVGSKTQVRRWMRSISFCRDVKF